MIIQIYEIQTREEALEVSKAGVDHIGLLVGNGNFPRELSIPEANQILKAIPATSKGLVLTLSGKIDEIHTIAEQLQPAVLHLGSLLHLIQPDHVQRLKKEFPKMKIMRSIPVLDAESVRAASEYDGISDFLLLDTHNVEDVQIGATGRTHDWNISRTIVQTVKTPVILAGGLTPENVRDAIRIVRPFGVDSKTGTDQTGTHRKDLDLVRRFVNAAIADGPSALHPA